MNTQPEILAPAGDSASFLAAMAAGADAIYVGLKHFSARMQAENFGATELSRLVELAHAHDTRVYVAMNTLLKPGDMNSAHNLVTRLARQVEVDAIIVQDPGFINIARQANFDGGIYLSTLANITHPAGLVSARKLGADRVILPRELSLDEIRIMGEACPEGLELETFVHGALCFCVSGRCYWSSYMGGKSGLRGRCVQPCRRIYKQGGQGLARQFAKAEEEVSKAKLREVRGKKFMDVQKGRAPRKPQRVGKEHSGRYFSCLDLSLDVLAKTLLDIPKLTSWKIEGRKKGPHYVYHVVSAYKLLRDNPNDSKAKKMAADYLEMALGRTGTKARFLPQKHTIPTDPNASTSSGLLIGKVGIEQSGEPVLKPYRDLIADDYLRIGVEDQAWHSTFSVTRRIPKAGSLHLRLPKHKTPKAGTPVFLIDRREPELVSIIKDWQKKLNACRGRSGEPVQRARSFNTHPVFGESARIKRRPDMTLRSAMPQGRETRGAKGGHMALWLSPKAQELSRTIIPRVAWWLPPVMWPEEEKVFTRLVQHMLKNGATHFVCNAPWQMEFFAQLPKGIFQEELDIMAGPFCNIANAAHLNVLKDMGFTAAFVSPELPSEDLLALPEQSPLPLGFMLDGFWPVGIARFGLLGVKANEPFVSPKGEIFWARNYGANVWIYPAWPMDFSEKRQVLENAGYSMFVRVVENPPQNLPTLRRDGLFNWDGELL